MGVISFDDMVKNFNNEIEELDQTHEVLMITGIGKKPAVILLLEDWQRIKQAAIGT